MIARVFKTFCLVWITGWLLIWILDIKAEYQHSDDYSINLPTGQSQFDTGRFTREMIAHGILLLLFWPDAAYIEVGCSVGACPLNHKKT